MNRRNIVTVDFNDQTGTPAGKDIFYLCLECKSIVESYPAEYTTCKCGNVFIDVDAGRGGANDNSKLIILKLE